MKVIGLSTLLGIVLTFLIIYLLHPLNEGAVTIVAIFCLSFSFVGVNSVKWIVKKLKKS